LGAAGGGSEHPRCIFGRLGEQASRPPPGVGGMEGLCMQALYVKVFLFLFGRTVVIRLNRSETQLTAGELIPHMLRTEGLGTVSVPCAH
jgi:hypothetical protein